MTRADREALARFIDQGRGVAPADLVIKGVGLLDVITGAVTETDIAICGDRIVGTYASYEGAAVIDGAGLTAVPGFIDTHLHVESSLVTPLEFDRCVLPHGVTTAICDPHEIANVLGAEGIRYFQACARHTLMDLRVQLSSCVPATRFETAGAELTAADLVALRGEPSGIGLAEFMNFPGVLFKDEGCLDKLAAFSGGHIDGHAPLLSGRDLNGYIAAGIRTEHEATTLEEAREKLMKGMNVLIREGSVSKDLHALIPLISPDTSAYLAFCTDDRNPLDIAEEGHLDYMIRTAIAHGAPLHHVYRVASLSAANAFGLTDRGLIAPGRRADIVLVDDLAQCTVRHVISAGRLVTPELFAARGTVAPVGLDSVKLAPTTADSFRIPANRAATRVIGVVPGRIITEDLAMELPIEGGAKQVDLAQDAVKVCVVERHGRSGENGIGNIGRGFVHGFGMKRGAIASSVGHDSHNICVVGVDDADMAVAVNRLIELHGGFAVAEGGAITAELALPVAGLMSDRAFEEVHDALIDLRAAAKVLGVVLPEPFLQVAFLPLPVIPHLKITDFGMFDVNRFELIEG
ncbi:adenine deaminase [Ancylobacter defluvii]|uniref:Adenine deaminase n=1 Tax=Ancylobacter defluvii TaxID=1282440 RepID=A0A9W6K180_9HYPH|nr:adenine deaminase [Ancylobacter defluvii]MBS7589471.1 adenine deaminase [Ancylobacter defluvii]GLK85088.1 adenine deaminase [Ancylobacter defluvii]